MSKGRGNEIMSYTNGEPELLQKPRNSKVKKEHREIGGIGTRSPSLPSGGKQKQNRD